MKLTKRVIGTCGVDAGMLMLCDPCYVQGEGAVAHYDSWDGFLKDSGMLKETTHGIVPFNRPSSTMHGKAVGVVVCSGHGDGEYPVTAWFNEQGDVVKIEVKFL